MQPGPIADAPGLLAQVKKAPCVWLSDHMTFPAEAALPPFHMAEKCARQ